MTDNVGLVQVNLNYKLGKTPSERFRFKISSLTGEIFILHKNSLLSTNHKWLEMPKLVNSTQIKIVTDKTVSVVEITVLDTKTGRIYRGNKVKIWNSAEIKTYIQRLNKQLL